MKNLARHIELLLRDNDCVVLPGFGGFIAHDVPAYYVGEEGLYYPPTRSISFNAAISMNDGLLAQSYMKSYQVDYARANHMIDMAIEQLTDTLDEEGCVTLPRIGTITQDIRQAQQFIPAQAGIASPRHFGLGSFTIKELDQLNKPADAPRVAEVARKAKTLSLHINKEMLRRAMSTAAIILLLFIIALPTGNHRPTDVASLRLTEIITAPQIQPAETTPTIAETVTAPIEEAPILAPIGTMNENVTEESTIVATENITHAVEPTVEAAPVITEAPTTIEAPAPEAPQPVATEARAMKTYHIIVASLPNHRGADEALAQYVKQGHTGVSLVERDNRVRISLVQFTDKDEANEYLKTLRQNEKFQNAWLLAVRN